MKWDIKMMFEKINSWNNIILGDCCKEKPSYGINAAAVEFNEELPRYIRITDIDDYGRFSPNKLTSVNEKGWEDFILKKDDVLFVRTGSTTGKSYLYQEKDGELVYAGFLIKFSVDKTILLPYYLKLFTESSFYNQWVSVMSVRSGQPGINSKEYSLLPIHLPPLKEQQEIAKILSTWDEAIETTQSLIEKLQFRKKGLMQELLSGKKRLAGFSEQWEEMRLGEVTNRITKKNTELNDTVITISAQRGFVRQEDYFKKRVASKTLSGYYLIEKGHFAYNKSYSKGYPMGAFKRLDTLEKAVVTTLYICFEAKENIDSDFLLNYFEGGMITKNLTKIAQEGGRAHGLLNIGINEFFALKLTVPSLSEQKAISKIIDLSDIEISEKKAYLLQLKNQKKGLMQQLLTGKKRVKL
ncbi:restriction endonuclease subunit S [Tenacibaculum finnmarkense]|uniref:restriction endonuclease subunit S n=1 Tax=Tenacibaculum finnmarkense TaxID=2781243 RepID=UPI001EFADEF3|nr:restriction endonuclease subunit S [Tenacibaculum finnmarkense]MCG8801962.1 restriction endonuclease subunit S [Tenacibaculum finnmarkense]MCG8824691.1 restriction endonuclease subunit S [Tenacibaculum finnmarkense]